MYHMVSGTKHTCKKKKLHPDESKYPPPPLKNKRLVSYCAYSYYHVETPALTLDSQDPLHIIDLSWKQGNITSDGFTLDTDQAIFFYLKYKGRDVLFFGPQLTFVHSWHTHFKRFCWATARRMGFFSSSSSRACLTPVPGWWAARSAVWNTGWPAEAARPEPTWRESPSAPGREILKKEQDDTRSNLQQQQNPWTYCR